MLKKKFSNGLTFIYEKRDSELVVVNVSVLIGSDHEEKKLLGISHLVEHLVFEGTKNRTCLQISNEIESLGGELNAYTSNEKTCYYIKIDKKHARKAFEILSDIVINPIFEEKTIQKEKNVVLEEIKMVNDDPRQYQWIYHMSKLFNKPYSNPTYGSVATVKNLTRDNIVNHFTKHYNPRNIIITVVGNCNASPILVDEFFVNNQSWLKNKTKNERLNINKKLPIAKSNKGTFVNKKASINQAYLVIGYPGYHRLNRISLIFDIITSVLARGQSGKLFDEIRTKRGLTYDLGVIHNPGNNYGFFAFYSSSTVDKIKIIEEIFFMELKKLIAIKDSELADAKSYITGNMALRREDSHYIADTLSFYEECGNSDKFSKYKAEIESVTKEEVIIYLKKYLLDRDFVKTLILPTSRKIKKQR